jgi:hypothetical protein
MRERHQLSFGLRLESEEIHHSAIRTKKELDFGGFFHQVSMRQPIGRQDSVYANREPNKQEVGFIFAWSGSEL